MRAADIAALRQQCTRGESPSCAAACPLHVDVRAITEKLKQGDVQKAFFLYERAVLFPRIVAALCPAPCEALCPSALKIRALESYCLSALNVERTGRMPARNKKVAVIDGGLTGLACALRLSEHGWGVELFSSGERPGGKIWDILPEKLILADFEVLYKSRIVIRNNSGCENPEDFDCVYSPVENVSIYGIQCGLRDAESIEKALKLDTQPQFDYASPDTVQLMPEPEHLDLESAAAEAKKCGGCECSDCIRNCAMMRYFGRTPEKLFVDVAGTLGVAKALSKRIAQRQIFSCNMCGLCDCPSGIDFEEMFADSRQAIFETGRVPQAYHQFWMRDMQHAMSESSFLALGGQSNYMFFPGCQLGASKPEYVTKAYSLLRNELSEVSLLLACCGAPAYWAGDTRAEQELAVRLNGVWQDMGRPKVITACPSCMKQLERICPEWDSVSLYELLSDYPIAANVQGRQAAVFDPCAAKELSRVKESVRKIAQNSGFSLMPSPKESCCGTGGHMRAVAPELFEQIAENRAFSSGEDAITYCANCRDIFASRGKPAIHIMDLLCEESLEVAFHRPAPSWGERRRNRELLKASLADMPVPHEGTKLIISEELMAKLQNELLTEQEILKTIQSCEDSGTKLSYAGSNTYIGHMRSGAITIWVEYCISDCGYELRNAYYHRMDITEGVPDGVR